MITEFRRAITTLKQTYNVLGTIDLSCAMNHDSRTLNDQLSQLKKQVFEPNDRIVVFLEGSDVYDFVDYPGRGVVSLCKSLASLDIPNFAVILVANNPNTAAELHTANQTTEAPVSAVVIDAPDFNKNIKHRDTMCVMPWIHLYLGTDGNALPCCVADKHQPYGNIYHQTIEELVNSPVATTLRENMLAGRPSKMCESCYLSDDQQSESLRTAHNQRWRQEFTEIQLLKDQTPAKPISLDVRLSNICNLKCRMCSGYYSSSIAQEEAILFNNTAFKSLPVSTDNKNEALTKIVELIPSAKEIYFAGGEPLIMADHYAILDALIDSNNTSATLTYSTNFTQLTYKSKSALDYWKKFTNVNVSASIDAMGDVAEYIRHGTKWPNIENNVQLIQSECPHVRFDVSSTVGVFNVPSLISLQKSWITSGWLKPDQFDLTIISTPAHMSLQVLPARIKDQLAVAIDQHCDWLRSFQCAYLISKWQGIVKYMFAKDCSHLIPELLRLTRVLDQFRNENFSKALPEFQELITYHKERTSS